MNIVLREKKLKVLELLRTSGPFGPIFFKHFCIQRTLSDGVPMGKSIALICKVEMIPIPESCNPDYKL